MHCVIWLHIRLARDYIKPYSYYLSISHNDTLLCPTNIPDIAVKSHVTFADVDLTI